jgi:hypothetical protein
MFGFNSPPQRRRRPVNAATINAAAEEVARQSRARPGGAIAAVAAGGTPLPYSTTRRSSLARITSVGTSTQAGSYGWQAIYGDPNNPGTYVDDPGWSGSLTNDPAWEFAGNPSLTVGQRIELKRDYQSGEMRFQLATCSS